MQLRIPFCVILFIMAGVFLMNSCQPGDKNNQEVRKKKEPEDLGQIGALPDTCRYPADNPPSIEKKELGRLLFYDPILSGGKEVACATCHHSEFMYAESLEISIGVNGSGLGEHRKFNNQNDIPFTKRNSQSLLNTAFNGIDINGNYSPEKAPMFWDLRANGLEEQALLPIKTFEEMRGHGFEEGQISEVVVKRLTAIAAYRNLFRKAFPGSTAIGMDQITKSLATFQRSLIANNSRFDQYMRGNKSALSNREIEGMALFITTGCARCHSGPMLSDFKTHVMGIADNEKLAVSDSGFQHSYAFRTPTLRNLRFTRPYMHSGKIQTLENVLTFYEDLQGKELPNKNVKREQLDPLALKLKVDFKNINPIIEFLNTLNDDHFDKEIPASVPSGLPAGGRIK
jgi:cytochrome c peroxidase